MPLYATLVREYSRENHGHVFGAVAMVRDHRHGVGPWLGGWIYDKSRRLFCCLHRLVSDPGSRGGGRLTFRPPEPTGYRSPVCGRGLRRPAIGRHGGGGG